MNTKLLTTLAVLAFVASTGCSQKLTKQQWDQIGVGSKPDNSIVISTITSYLQKTLIDPDSMKLSCAESKKGWIRDLGFKPHKYGWVVYCDVNGRNRMGGYAGSRPYAFLFVGNNLVDTWEKGNIGYDFDFSPY